MALAVEQQVQRLVALSAANIDDDDMLQPSRFRGDRNREADQLAMSAGLPAVSLRPSVFASTAADMWATQIRNGDVVRGPYEGASFAPVVDEDIAAVAVHALTDDTLVGRRVVLTGPEVLTVADQVATIGEVLGRPLRFVEVGPDAVRGAMTGAGAAPAFVNAYLALQRAAVDNPATVTDEIATITGRPAARFRDWVVAHRDLFEA
ncbi:nucleoside-diphosphate sugar epimerase [Williamsia serinedens]|uniref:Uncharacterized protein n=1 Tax=Williamsia serinedens TaxID=391736 RepID=A0ABT1H4M3_9NOCA|nr:nucleoside-diphosphate sugar epimerase [Williamsia serinedens]MCP2161523.1 hypothetical protein [Williamsia serinedens]